MNIRVDKRTKDQLDEWGIPSKSVARKCVNRYKRAPWPISSKKTRKVTVQLQDIPEDLGFEKWKLEMIIDDAVDMAAKESQPETPITLETE